MLYVQHSHWSLVRIITRDLGTGLGEALDSLSNTTLLAPSNEAIRAVADDVKQSWINDPDQLKDVLFHHVLQSKVHQSTLNDNQLVDTRYSDHKLRFNLHQSVKTHMDIELNELTRF